MLLGIVFVAIILLLILITKMKVNPFISLMIVSFFVGLSTGMPLDKIVVSIQAGLGNTLGFIAIVLGLGTMLGKLMEESGAAERVEPILAISPGASPELMVIATGAGSLELSNKS